MQLIDWVMVIICLMIGVISAYTDIQKRLIPNRLLYPAFAIMFPLGLIYHFLTEMGTLYLANVLLVIAFSILLYAVHYFSAGDSKLMIVLASSMPAHLYQETLHGLFPIMAWVIIVFSAAFVYLIGESIWLAVKKQKRYSKKSSIKQILSNYLPRLIVVTGVSECVWFLFPEFFAENQYIIILLDYFLILILSDHLSRLNKTSMCVMGALVLAFGVVCGYLNGFHLSSLAFLPFIITLWLLQAFLSAYNYRSIATSDIEAGMILSLETSVLMQRSKVKGLPEVSTEDMCSKLSESEAESIRRWGKSKYGSTEITIVRTLPFGALMALGSAIFIIERIFFVLWGA